MNNSDDNRGNDISPYQLEEFQKRIHKLFQCCQERTQYQSERFELPDAELRCLLHFSDERYMTPTKLARKMNVAKSRVTKIVGRLIKRGLVAKVKDPADSRYHLLSLTPTGQNKLNDIKEFTQKVHSEILSQVPPEQRNALLTFLNLLETSMESVKDLMW
jgi:DNA-binding MarR family transcriptional regulator